MRLVLHLSMLGLCLALTRVAQAGPPAVEPSTSEAFPQAPPPVEYDDYRLTLFGVDAASVSLLALGAFAGENEGVATTLVALGLGGYAFGGPIVHLGHGQGERALGSFALRVGLPAPGILMAVGLASSCGPGDDADLCRLAGVAFGGLFVLGGALAAMIVDDTFLGKAPKPSKYAETRKASGFSLALFPHFEPRTKAAGASLAGAF